MGSVGEIVLKPEPGQDPDFNVEIDGQHVAFVCGHGPGTWRVGFDWGAQLKVFENMDDVQAFLAELAKQPLAWK